MSDALAERLSSLSLAPEDLVVVCGLESAPQYNYRAARVCDQLPPAADQLPPAADRVPVVLLHGAAGKKKVLLRRVQMRRVLMRRVLIPRVQMWRVLLRRVKVQQVEIHRVVCSDMAHLAHLRRSRAPVWTGRASCSCNGQPALPMPSSITCRPGKRCRALASTW